MPYLSKYQHASPRRKDSGTYKIQATNKYGQDTAELEIIVTCEYILLFIIFIFIGKKLGHLAMY